MSGPTGPTGPEIERFNPDNPAHLLMWCIRNRVNLIMLPFMSLIRRARVKKSQAADVGGGRVEIGELLLRSPAYIAKMAKGPDEEKDIFILLQIPRAAYERAKSPIIVTGNMPTGTPERSH